MMNLQGEKKNIIIIDIESTKITAGFFSYEETKQQSIKHCLISSESKVLYKGNNISFDRFYAETLRNISEILETLIKKTLLPFESVYINLATPWASAQKKNLEYHNESLFTVTQEIIDTLIQKEYDQSLDYNLDFAGHGVRLIERYTLGTYVNGYRTGKPIGEKTKDIVIHSLISVMSEQTHKDFSHAVERITHREPIFLSNIWTRFSAFQTKFPQEDNILILDVAGKITELVIVRHDEIINLGSFPCGIYHLVDEISHQKNISFEKSLAYLKNINEQILDTKDTDFLDKVFSIWLKEAYSFFEEFSKESLLPETLALSIDKDFYAWFSGMLLSSEELIEHIHARKNISILPYFDHNQKNEEIYLIADFLINTHIKI
jgi:cell division ATPase FtsA